MDYYFISVEKTMVGFFKLKTEINNFENGDFELEKFHILPSRKGKGIGKFVLNKIIVRL